ncbi:TetR family transcriptional regulator [Streptomyces sp. NPDC008150]|uniref:TetR family transcriptional regulator n=1 Tax=Streptomyces sp. NPDC008150 TaxID=3364816 RepID=UPI0036F15BFF
MDPSPTDRQPRPRDAEATRLALLRAARRRFAVLGYDRTTTRDVAGDAGVNLMLINRYFGGKQGLFQAVLAASPDPVADGETSPKEVVGDFLDGLRPDAWPEFGVHPMLLLLRDSSADEQVRELRASAMSTAATRIAALRTNASADTDGGKCGAGDGDPDGNGQAAQLRAQLVLAMFSGVVALRTMTPVEPLASADVGDLRTALEEAVRSLLDLPPSSGRDDN